MSMSMFRRKTADKADGDDDTGRGASASRRVEEFRKHLESADRLLSDSVRKESMQIKGLPFGNWSKRVATQFEELVHSLRAEVDDSYQAAGSQAPTGPCFHILMEQRFLEKACRVCSEDKPKGALNAYISLLVGLLDRVRLPWLLHQSFLLPLGQVLKACKNWPADQVEGRTGFLHLLCQVCKKIADDEELLSVFFDPKPDEAAFPVFSALLPFLSDTGDTCRMAREALMLCMHVSERRGDVPLFIIERTNFCESLASGLSGRFSRLPTVLPKDAWRLTPRQISEHVPQLAAFLDALEFCDQVLSIADRKLAGHVLRLLRSGFLDSVMRPAMASPDSALAAMAYYDAALCAIQHAPLMGQFLHMLMDGSPYPLLELIVRRIDSKGDMPLVALRLLHSLLSLNCEDIMLELCLRRLMTGDHLKPGAAAFDLQRRYDQINNIVNGEAAKTFLSLRPPSVLSPSNTTFEDYCEDARRAVAESQRACACWSHAYNSPETSTASTPAALPPSPAVSRTPGAAAGAVSGGAATAAVTVAVEAAEAPSSSAAGDGVSGGGYYAADGVTDPTSPNGKAAAAIAAAKNQALSAANGSSSAGGSKGVDGSPGRPARQASTKQGGVARSPSLKESSASSSAAGGEGDTAASPAGKLGLFNTLKNRVKKEFQERIGSGSSGAAGEGSSGAAAAGGSAGGGSTPSKGARSSAAGAGAGTTLAINGSSSGSSSTDSGLIQVSLLDVLLRRLERLAHNTLVFNLLLTAVIVRLACYPQGILREYMLNPQAPVRDHVRTLFLSLQIAAGDVASLAQRIENFETLVAATRNQGAVSVRVRPTAGADGEPSAAEGNSQVLPRAGSLSSRVVAAAAVLHEGEGEDGETAAAAAGSRGRSRSKVEETSDSRKGSLLQRQRSGGGSIGAAASSNTAAGAPAVAEARTASPVPIMSQTSSTTVTGAAAGGEGEGEADDADEEVGELMRDPLGALGGPPPSLTPAGGNKSGRSPAGTPGDSPKNSPSYLRKLFTRGSKSGGVASPTSGLSGNASAGGGGGSASGLLDSALDSIDATPAIFPSDSTSALPRTSSISGGAATLGAPGAIGLSAGGSGTSSAGGATPSAPTAIQAAPVSGEETVEQMRVRKRLVLSAFILEEFLKEIAAVCLEQGLQSLQ
eukprot:m.178878 g.178878  ORF g.178878 m.178878 type:complete len:1154 (-) comp17402_c0_seq2:211-3672(-)